LCSKPLNAIAFKNFEGAVRAYLNTVAVKQFESTVKAYLSRAKCAMFTAEIHYVSCSCGCQSSVLSEPCCKILRRGLNIEHRKFGQKHTRPNAHNRNCRPAVQVECHVVAAAAGQAAAGFVRPSVHCTVREGHFGRQAYSVQSGQPTAELNTQRNAQRGQHHLHIRTCILHLAAETAIPCTARERQLESLQPPVPTCEVDRRPAGGAGRTGANDLSSH